ncbi:carboxymuconolactone decarboxylase family protein [Azospirillum brasilense]|nr:carboxymuconolactone decarboxylase family protein [Azospirillum brasilense]
MPLKPIEHADAAPEVRAVYDDIKATRNVPAGQQFREVHALPPAALRLTGGRVKEGMDPGARDRLVEERIFVAVSVTNGCDYCIRSHEAAARRAGMTDAQFGELMAVIGMANETNRLAKGYQVEIDEALK